MTIEEIKESIEVIKAYRQMLTDSVSNQIDEDIKAFDVAVEAMEQEHCEDASGKKNHKSEARRWKRRYLKLREQTRWIPVSERLPEDLEPVNITWVNHEPEPYYHDIKDRNFVATGIYYRGQWYWYSTTCADYLGEYGSNEIDKVDDAVEIIAWMPLPEPYEPQEGSGEE